MPRCLAHFDTHRQANYHLKLRNAPYRTADSKNNIYSTTMKAEEIINQAEDWSKTDQKNRCAAVILSDETTRQYYVHYAGTSKDMAHLINALMCEDEEFAHDIFAAAMVYAQKHIAQEEIDKITLVAKTIAEVRNEQQQSRQ